MLSHIPQERVMASRIHVVLGNYGKEYYVPTITTQTNLVDKLVTSINDSESFREAFTVLGLKDIMDKIIEMSKEIMDNLSKRIATNGDEKKRREGVRKAAYRDMKIMIDTINCAYQNNRDDQEKRDDFEHIMLNIDDLLMEFRTPMKSRRTKSKNKRAVAEAVKELIKTQLEPHDSLPIKVGKLKKESSTLLKNSASAGLETRKMRDSLINPAKNTAGDMNDQKPIVRDNLENSSKNNSSTTKKRGNRGVVGFPPIDKN